MASSNNDDWRSQFTDIASKLNKARSDAKFTDIQFEMGQGDSRKEFNAHKVILACASPVFEKMFYGPMAEKRDIIETDDDPEAFEMLLNYIYGKKEKCPSLKIAWKYFTIGDKYLEPQIQDAAMKYVKQYSLTENDFWDIVENERYSSEVYLDKINKFFIKYTTKIITSEKFINVPESFVENILQLEHKFFCSRKIYYDILVAVTKWAHGKRSVVDSKWLIKFYKHIHFSMLSNKDFLKFIDSYPQAIEEKDKFQILKHLNVPSEYDLPNWCSKRPPKIKGSREQDSTDCKKRRRSSSENSSHSDTNSDASHSDTNSDASSDLQLNSSSSN